MNQLTIKKVADQERINFLPKHVNPQNMLVFENYLYCYADELFEQYSGGYWEFYEISNGGFFLVPEEKQYSVLGNISYEIYTIDCMKAGIIATIFAMSAIYTKTMDETLLIKYYRLKDYIYTLDNVSRNIIFDVID